jgi:hypothetical protein
VFRVYLIEFGFVEVDVFGGLVEVFDELLDVFDVFVEDPEV